MAFARTLLHNGPASMILLALAYYASGKLGLYFPTHDTHITLFWLPTGMAAALLLRWGSPWLVGGIFLGAFLFDLSLGTGILLSTLSAAGNTLTPLTAAWLLKRWRFDPSFSRQNDLLALTAAALISTPLPAVIGIVSLWLGDLLQPSGMALAWLNWWLGDLISILLIAPPLLSLSKSSLAEMLRRPVELTLCTLLLILSATLVFAVNLKPHILPLAFMPLPLLLWAALRLGVTGASLAVLTLSLITTIGTAMGKGVFGLLSEMEGMYMAWLYMFIAALIGLMVTTMLGERKRIEESLRSANDLLHETQSVARIGSWKLNVLNRELQWSDETYRIFDVPPGTVVDYELFLAQVHPDDRAMVDSAWQAALHGAPYQVQHRIIVKGKVRWVEERARLDVDSDGKLLAGTGSVQDITDSKQAEQRIARSEARYRAFIQQAADALFIHDLDGVILEVNQQACDTLGYSSEELCGMHLEKIAPKFRLNESQPRWELLEPGKPVCFNASHRHKDGHIFPVEVRLVAMVLDQQKLILALTSDITERRRFEAALQESEQRYRSFAEHLPLGIFITQDGLIKHINQASIELIGYTRDELLDQPFFPLVHEADRGWQQELHQRWLEGERIRSPYVLRVVRKDGQVRQWEVHASVIDWKGKRSGLGVIADITERIALEERLRDSLHQLEEKELAKTRFLAAAGHDLRQPIAAANLYVETLKLSTTNERQARLVERLDQSMNVFSGLLESLLNISRFDAGLIKPQLKLFDLTEMFYWVEQNFAQTSHNNRVDLRLSCPLHKPLIVRTDIALLQSVVMNLVTNAIKFTQQGAILVSARRRGDQVLLQVWDTGCGIAEADLPYIFDEFYQANNPQRSREAGLGLGLSICQRAMALLGGKVSCRSRLGHGSVFSLSIPLCGEQERVELSAAQHPQADASADRGFVLGKRVVVLEDDALVANGLADLLQGLGAEAMLYSDAESALQQHSTRDADFCIVDYALNGKLNGIDFLHTLQRGRPQRLRAVVITGETSSAFISRTGNTPWPILHKPVNLQQLLASLQQQG